MSVIREIYDTKCAKRIYFNNNHYLTLYKPKKIYLDAVLKLGGFTVMYAVGYIAGRVISADFPRLNQSIQTFLTYLPGVKAQSGMSNLSGLLGIMLGTYGAVKSGAKINKVSLECRVLEMFPFKIR